MFWLSQAIPGVDVRASRRRHQIETDSFRTNAHRNVSFTLLICKPSHVFICLSTATTRSRWDPSNQVATRCIQRHRDWDNSCWTNVQTEVRSTVLRLGQRGPCSWSLCTPRTFWVEAPKTSRVTAPTSSDKQPLGSSTSLAEDLEKPHVLDWCYSMQKICLCRSLKFLDIMLRRAFYLC